MKGDRTFFRAIRYFFALGYILQNTTLVIILLSSILMVQVTDTICHDFNKRSREKSLEVYTFRECINPFLENIFRFTPFNKNFPKQNIVKLFVLKYLFNSFAFYVYLHYIYSIDSESFKVINKSLFFKISMIK